MSFTSFCWFGYGFCGSITPEETLTANVVQDDVLTSIPEDKTWGLSISLLNADFEGTFNSFPFRQILMASFIGGVTASCIFYVSLREYLLPRITSLVLSPKKSNSENTADSINNNNNNDQNSPEDSSNQVPTTVVETQNDDNLSMLEMIPHPEQIKNPFVLLLSSQGSNEGQIQDLSRVESRIIRTLKNQESQTPHTIPQVTQAQSKTSTHATFPARPSIHAVFPSKSSMHAVFPSKSSVHAVFPSKSSIHVVFPSKPPTRASGSVKSSSSLGKNQRSKKIQCTLISSQTKISIPKIVMTDAATQKDIMEDSKPYLEFHQYPRGTCIPCENPWGMKLECLLRLFQVPHSIVLDCTTDDSKGPWLIYHPTGKSGPAETIHLDANLETFVEFLYDNFPECREKLNSTKVSIKKKVPTHFIKTLVQFHLTPVICRWRTLEKLNKSTGVTTTTSSIIANYINDVKQQTTNNGHASMVDEMSVEELRAALHNDLTSLSASLDKKKYFIGGKVSTIDCSVFAIVCQLTFDSPNSEAHNMMFSYRNLIQHCYRIRRSLWPDWDSSLEDSPMILPTQCESILRTYNRMNNNNNNGSSVDSWSSSQNSSISSGSRKSYGRPRARRGYTQHYKNNIGTSTTQDRWPLFDVDEFDSNDEVWRYNNTITMQQSLNNPFITGHVPE